jgi:hypothetical protein
MAFTTKQNLTDAKFYQQSGGTMTLSGDTVIAVSGDIQYESHPTFTIDTQLIDKKYVDDNVVSGSTYNLGSPAAVEVGGICIGTVLTGKTSNCILEEMLYPELCGTLTAPSMTSVVVTPGTTPIEIGTACNLTITASFSRGSINPQYCSASPNRSGAPISYCFTGPGLDDSSISCTADSMFTGLTAYVITAGVNTWGSCTCYSAGVQPKSNKDVNFDAPLGAGIVAAKTDSITGILPYFYGASDTEPTANQALINTTTGATGSKTVATSTGTLYITYGALASKWLWFATPLASTCKCGWYESVSNHANIGSPSDLFNAPSEVLIDSPNSCWSGECYRIYLSTYSTDTSANVYCMTNATQQ